MRLQDMAQNSSFSDTINGEATKAGTNAHPQNSFPGKAVALKTIQVFLKTSYQLYRAIFKPISDRQIFQYLKISKCLSASSLNL